MNRTRTRLFTCAVAAAILCASCRLANATTAFDFSDLTNEAQASAAGTNNPSQFVTDSSHNPASAAVTNGGHGEASASWSLSNGNSVLQIDGVGAASGSVSQTGGDTGSGLATFQAGFNLSNATAALIHVVGSVSRGDSPIGPGAPDLIFSIGPEQKMLVGNGTINIDDQVLVGVNSRINAYALDTQPSTTNFGAGSGYANYHLTMTMLPLSDGNVGVANGSVLSGAGVLNPVAFSGSAAGTLTNNGAVSPGGADAIGALEYDGTGGFNQSSSGELDIKLGGAGLGNYDVLQIPDGAAALGGALNVSLLHGYTPQLGDKFDIISANLFSGGFDALNLPALPNGERWDTSVVGDPVFELQVVPEPSSFVLVATALAGFAVLSLRRRTPRLG